MEKKVYKLGTRRSLLAWAQSKWVAEQIKKKNPNTEIELIGIETQGDRILDIPLQKVEGKEFFVAELDRALLAKQVDLTVHSLKDLSLDRPSELFCAAIPKRKNPRDIALFGKNILEKLRKNEKIRIGTSSPRRLENTPIFLKGALPRFHQDTEPKLEFREIRGNVNSRIARLHEDQNSVRHLDGVILAFAGLIRLWEDPSGREELGLLLKNVRWMILPIAECPTNPGQGALAIECRSDDLEIRPLIQTIHDPSTAAEIATERKYLSDFGGGCHQRFGATELSPFGPELGIGPLCFIRGVTPQGHFVDEMTWKNRPESPKQPVSDWDGGKHHSSEIRFLPAQDDLKEGQALFVAHWRAVGGRKLPHSSRVWTSGVGSWKKLASLGIWVEGCAENFGFNWLESTLQEEVLQLPEFSEWLCLTHEGAVSEWLERDFNVQSTYQVDWHCSEVQKEKLSRATHLFWSSGSQFDALRMYVSARAHHSCGAGKTWQHLMKLGVTPTAFPSAKEWRKWILKPEEPA